MCLCKESFKTENCVENGQKLENTEVKQSKNVIFIEDDETIEKYMFTL